jgi:ABC-type sugar transport system ATPase subunit
MISSDAEEIAGCCDRILVLHEGGVVREFDRGRAAVDIMAAAGGTTPPDHPEEVKK